MDDISNDVVAEVRDVFDAEIHRLKVEDGKADADRIARLELLREYVCDESFRESLHEFCWQQFTE